MPWKGQIMKYLDRIDDTARMLNACNAVYLDGGGALCGTNTDWVGIEGALQKASDGVQLSRHTVAGLIVGAGGAARAAVYALTKRFGVSEIYILNRDDGEVEQLLRDCGQMPASILHLKSSDQARGMRTPSFIIGTVPDFEPITLGEKAIKSILTTFLVRDREKGVMLDMCYHPRWTRILKLAQEHGWRTVQGTQVVGHQIEALWGLWVDDERSKQLDRAGMWKALEEVVDRSAMVNPKL